MYDIVLFSHLRFFRITALLAIEHVTPVEEGGVVYVSSAAGGVGLVAVQIYKLMGATVIGSTGSDEKVSFLLNE